MLFKEKPITNYLLDKPSLFWTPEYLEISAWTEHIPFAFWIIEVLKPKITVELGVHTGTSYFSFCQAVKRLNMDAVCYGVDTWKGDEHSGLYEEEVYSKVLDYNNEKYSEFSTLIRSSFDEAKDYFIDGSIDLLHIDGLHTYDAVRHDFENWFPKLSADAIVVFHDINVRERNFGVFRLWEELKQQYRSFQFDFGHGLGILAIGEVAGELEILLDTHRNDEYYIFLRNLFSERGRSFKNKFDASFLIKQERENLETQRKNLSQITERYKMLESNNNLLQESNTALENSNQIHQASLTELKEKLNLANSTYVQITKELADQQNKMEELNNLIQKQSQIIRWYKNTYEDRNIIGVLKEKLTSRLKKKINPSTAETLNNLMPGYLRKNRYTVNPAKDILFLPDSHEYASYGPDPYFTVDLVKKKLNAGWYWLSIDIVEVKGMLIAPKLYYDCGRGFNEEDVWNLPEISNGKIVSLIKFPGHIHGFRFDPTINECTFKLHDFDLKALSTIQAFNRAISKYKEINYPQKSYLNIYKEFLGDFIKTGKSGIRKKIWDSITYRKDNSLNEYWAWCSLYDTISPGQKKRIEFLADQLSYQPVFSIIMPVFNAPLNLLKMAIESVVNQAYKNWELCIADDKSTNEDVKKMLIECQQEDPRIKVVLRETNGHISKASNSALAIATGDYVVLLDQDDELPVHCLFMVAETLNKNRNLGIIYSDEDKIDEMGNRFDPYFKTDWNKDLFYGQNMISHLGVYKHSLIKKIGGFRVGFEGSQDYDLALRCLEHLNPDQIYHIPHVLYHWRAIKGSTAIAVSNKDYAVHAGLNALQDHFERTGQNAIAEENVYNSYRVKWTLPVKKPKVSIIIPTKDKVDILSACIDSLFQNTSYSNFEVLIVDNNSQEADTLSYFENVQLQFKQLKVHSYKAPFNFSAMINYGVEQAKGEIVVLLNNDTSVINKDWLCEMVSQSLRKDVGAVGAKLFYPNGQIQHAGVFLYEGHPGNHMYLRRDKNDPGYFNKLNLVQNYSAVTGACLAIRKELFVSVGGLDEKNLKVAYNDVDLCLRVGALGFNNVWTPFAQLFHYESLSRGLDLDGPKLERFKKEHSYMLAKWQTVISRDPFFNPNLDPAFSPSIDPGKVRYAFPPQVEYEWQKESINDFRKQLM